MGWRVVLTHGNNPEDETVVEDFDAALEWIVAEEARIHDGNGQQALNQMVRTFTWGSEDTGSVQYGTDYHYVNIDKGM